MWARFALERQRTDEVKPRYPLWGISARSGALGGVSGGGIGTSGDFFGIQNYKALNSPTSNYNIVPVHTPKPSAKRFTFTGVNQLEEVVIKRQSKAIGRNFPNFKTDIGIDLLKFKGLHYGVPEFETSLLNDRGAVTPGSFVLYPIKPHSSKYKSGSRDPFYNTHEPGHVLQFFILAKLYYPLIAIPSVANTIINCDALDYTEKSANQLWYWFTGESDISNPKYTN